jgi:hypothetical protein
MSNGCKQCDKYKQRGHNYCRMCGFHLRKGYAPRARLALAYYTNEKFCGYCGGTKQACSCVQSKSDELGAAEDGGA